MIDVIKVLLDGRPLGALHWQDESRMATFQYHPDFIASGLEVSPLRMPLRNTPYAFPELAHTRTFSGLPGLIADSLPERFGNQLLSAWLQSHGRTFDSLSPLERLAYLGNRGMGALEFEPDWGGGNETPLLMDVHELVDVAREVLAQRHSAHARLTAGMEHLVQVGTSAGGAKAKAVIAWHPETGDVLSGQVTAPAGYQYWIIKFDEIENEELATAHQIGRIEMAYHRMAVEAGVTMMESRLMPDGNRAHFMTRRFDRGDNGEKYHVQTFAALTHQDRDPPGAIGYESLFFTARALGLPQSDLDQIYRRMVFNILARNQDDHAKNHAFIMDNDGTWLLSPAYDVCYSYKPGSRWIGKHQMRCNNKRDDFTLEDLLQAAHAADVKRSITMEIISEVRSALGRWNEFADEVDLNTMARNQIREAFRKL